MNLNKIFLLALTLGCFSISASAFASDTCPSCACYLKKEVWDVSRKDVTDSNRDLRKALTFSNSAVHTKIRLDSQVRSLQNNVFSIQKDLIRQQARFDKAISIDKGYRAEENNLCHGFLGTINSLTSSYHRCISIEKRNSRSNANVQLYKDRIKSITAVYKQQQAFYNSQLAIAQKIQGLEVNAQISYFTTATSIAANQVTQQTSILNQAKARTAAAKSDYYACIDSI